MKTLLSFLLIAFLMISSSVEAQNALSFDGANDFVQTTYGGVVGNNDRTFEAWVKINSNASGNNCIMDYGLNAVGSRNTFLINDNNQLSYIAGGTNTNFSSSTNAITRDVWMHVAMVMDNGTGYFYVNGVQVGTGNLSGVSTPNGNSNLRIGQRVPGGNIPFLGEIDEVRVWSVARTASEIQATMNSEFCIIPSSLEAYYQFDQGIANGSNSGVTSLVDVSAGANNGTLTNFALTGTSSNWVNGVSVSSHITNAGIFSTSACIPFTTLGNRILNSSGFYEDTVVMLSGCDSIYSLAFTALDATSSNFSISACDTYTAPSGSVYTSSGTIMDTTQNADGCDSIMTINLTINNSAQSTLSSTTCNTYTSPSGKVFTSTGIYLDTIPSLVVCDSIITIDLVINNNSSSSISVSECLTYTSPSGITYTTSGFYNDTIPNTVGCDSIIGINLTILNTTLISQNLTACDTFISPSGKIWTNSGLYQDTVIGGVTCASIYTIDLEVYSSVNTSVTESSCDPYTSDLGNTYTISGVYTETTQTINGCDSIITLDLTIVNIDKTISQNGFTLTANEIGNTYQWYNCEGSTIISGETSQSFTPATSGSYFVEIETDLCTFNSMCYEILNVSIDELNKNDFNVYPNPTNGIVHIDLETNYENVLIKVLNVEGRLVKNQTFVSINKIQLDLDLTIGLYTILVYTEDGLDILKVLKKE